MEFYFYLFQSILSIPVFLILFYHNFSTVVHWILGPAGESKMNILPRSVEWNLVFFFALFEPTAIGLNDFQ